mgnify:CR=1 FL=1
MVLGPGAELERGSGSTPKYSYSYSYKATVLLYCSTWGPYIVAHGVTLLLAVQVGQPVGGRRIGKRARCMGMKLNGNIFTGSLLRLRMPG